MDHTALYAHEKTRWTHPYTKLVQPASKITGTMLFLVAVLLCSIASVTSQASPPIPLVRTYPGSVYGNSTASAQVKLEVFLELNCGDSAAAWSELKRVAEHYSPSQLQLIVHHLPLPYHRNAFLCTQGFYLIEDQVSDKKWAYLEEIFENRGDFSGSANFGRTEAETIRILAEYANKATGISIEQFELTLPYYAGRTVYNWKFATRKGMAGTPMYFVNGIDLARNPSNLMTYDDWRRTLDPLLE